MQQSDTFDAFRYSIPVLLGYLAIGTAFGLMMVNAGYPWWLSIFMSIVMYAGSGQYLAVSLLAAGADIPTIIIMQFILNARHMAYGITMKKPYNAVRKRHPIKGFYLIFAMTDETFALLSSLPPVETDDRGLPLEEAQEKRSRFMFAVSILDHSYWVAGSLIGSLAGALIPFNFNGVDFALTALFMVLLIGQIQGVRRPSPFIISTIITVLAVLFLPSFHFAGHELNITLITALVLSLAAVYFDEKFRPKARLGGRVKT